MPTKANRTFSNSGLQPVFAGEAKEGAVRLAPNLTLAMGTVLGQVTAASANEVQTIDVTGTVSGGTFTLSIIGPDGETYTTAALAYNISNANLKIAIEDLLEAAGYVNATVTIGGGALPTDATVTFGGSLAATNVPNMTIDDSLLTGGGSAAIVETTPGVTSGVFAAYNNGNSNGTEVAKAILRYEVVTDAQGQVSFADADVGGEIGEKHDSAPVFFTGRFKTTDLVGLDAGAVTDLGRLESGAIADGILMVYGP